jgi:putative Ca2+/H+ antiporter (TMEM165/GDT1 family)
MDWKLLGTTFVTVFLAELGDKTQLATMALAAAPGARWAVFIGASLALVATSALGVLAGELVGRYVSPVWVHRAAGALFLVLGTLLLVRGE